MKQSVAHFVRALTVLLLFVPAPLAMLNTPRAQATTAVVVAADPAVQVPVTQPAATEDPWTARFLAPAVVVIAVIAVGAAVSYYIVRIRGRYRIL
jgi:hypothetical protein